MRRDGGSCSANAWKSTRLNSSHMSISYAVFCLKKKCSSVSIVKAYESIQDDDPKKMRFWLLMTILCGATFVGIQVYEYIYFFLHDFAPTGVLKRFPLAELFAK